MKNIDILSFDVCGKMAHFRKYYANNTAFSYSIPPRTTAMGLLAAIMGYPRDTYYETLSSRHIRIGVRIVQPIKKTFHRLNYLSIKSSGDILKGTGDFGNASEHIQTPFEMITGYNISTDTLCYRFFIACGEENNGEFDKIQAAIINKNQKFNISLGVANFNAWIENAVLHKDTSIKTSDSPILIHSAVPSEIIGKLDFDKNTEGGSNFIEEELVPSDFIPNSRELSKLIRVLVGTKGLPFSAIVKSAYYSIPDEHGNSQNIFFLD